MSKHVDRTECPPNRVDLAAIMSWRRKSGRRENSLQPIAWCSLKLRRYTYKLERSQRASNDKSKTRAKTEHQPLKLVGGPNVSQIRPATMRGKKRFCRNSNWNMSLYTYADSVRNALRRAGKIIHDQHVFLLHEERRTKPGTRWCLEGLQELDRARPGEPLQGIRVWAHRLRPRQQQRNALTVSLRIHVIADSVNGIEINGGYNL